jgi:hypothetical protein
MKHKTNKNLIKITNPKSIIPPMLPHIPLSTILPHVPLTSRPIPHLPPLPSPYVTLTSHPLTHTTPALTILPPTFNVSAPHPRYP